MRAWNFRLTSPGGMGSSGSPRALSIRCDSRAPSSPMRSTRHDHFSGNAAEMLSSTTTSTFRMTARIRGDSR